MPTSSDTLSVAETAEPTRCASCYGSRRTFRFDLTSRGRVILVGYEPCPDCTPGAKK